MVSDGLGEVPPLPHVLRELLRELSDPQSSSRTVARIAASDPALAASLIRTVNSAAMGKRGHITSVSGAVSFLGYNAVRGIVIRMRLERILPTRPGQAGYDQEDLWVHSMAVAHAAECLAERRPDVDRGFISTLGLLHDIGKLAINSYFPRAAAQLVEPGTIHDESLLDRERRILGADHAEIGALLAEHWKLPGDLVEAIRHHHAPQSAPASLPGEIRTAAILVHLANQLAKYCYVHSQDMEIDIIPDDLFRSVNLAGPLTRLLSNRMRQAISRAIFFADESSPHRPIGAVRRFLRFCPKNEIPLVMSPARSSSFLEPRVHVAGERPEAMFDEKSTVIDCTSRLGRRFDPLSPTIKEAIRSQSFIHFSATAVPNAIDAIVTCACAHLDALHLDSSTRMAARLIVRRMLPNLVEIADPTEPVELLQRLDRGILYLAVRCPAMEFKRRFDTAIDSRAARSILEQELGNLLNLRWFDDLFTSRTGRTLLFVSRPNRPG